MGVKQRLERLEQVISTDEPLRLIICDGPSEGETEEQYAAMIEQAKRAQPFARCLIL